MLQSTLVKHDRLHIINLFSPETPQFLVLIKFSNLNSAVDLSFLIRLEFVFSVCHHLKLKIKK